MAAKGTITNEELLLEVIFTLASSRPFLRQLLTILRSSLGALALLSIFLLVTEIATILNYRVLNITSTLFPMILGKDGAFLLT